MGLQILKEVLNMLRMYGNGYSMAIVLDHRSAATSLTGNVYGRPRCTHAMILQSNRAPLCTVVDQRTTQRFLIFKHFNSLHTCNSHLS